MTMGDRVAVLNRGVLQQYGDPRELYDRPANLFVAEFVGSPEMNLYEASVSSSDELVLGSQRLALGPAAAVLAPFRGRAVIAGIRPEDLGLDGAPLAAGPGMASLVADVRGVETLGSETHVLFSIDARRAAPSAGTVAGAQDTLLGGDTHNGLARLDPRSEVRPGERVTFRVDPRRLHFFDPDSSGAIR